LAGRGNLMRPSWVSLWRMRPLGRFCRVRRCDWKKR